MGALNILKMVFAVYNATPREVRKEIGEMISSIPDFFGKIISGDEIDLNDIKPVMTSEEMEREFERDENERLSSGE